MSAPLLIELGCEELPARAIAEQVQLLADGLYRRLDEAGLLEPGAVMQQFATPRRLAVRIQGVLERQPDRRIERKGPAESAAFDEQGRPTRAAEGFARSVGIPVDQLRILENEQGRWLYAEIEQPGQPLEALLGSVLESTAAAMAGPRSMRWSDLDARFLRPVRWLVALHGDRVVPVSIFGLRADRITRGHRIHAPGPHTLTDADAYESVLEQAHVIAAIDSRRAHIVEQIEAQARAANLGLDDDPALIDEITGLVEWPVAVTGGFDEAFLEVPPEALVCAMRHHQKCFPLFAPDGALAPRFIAVANLQSRDPQAMIRGFERVIRPRLADARFFYEQDRRTPLEDRLPALEQMLFQARLGSLADKTHRLERLAAELTGLFGADPDTARRAARLCKCDLMTEMVKEFPELQGTMGRYYALADGEPEAVALAIESHYLPRQAGDRLPEDPAGMTLAVADRLDTLVGIFAAGLKPKGGKDPFALRRAALGLVRILEASRCAAPLHQLLDLAATAYADRLEIGSELLGEIASFIDQRLKAYLSERGIETNTLHAVIAAPQGTVADFIARAQAVQRFADDPEVASLIAANKRAANLLEQAEAITFGDVEDNLMKDQAEIELHRAIGQCRDELAEYLRLGDYDAALHRLARLKPVVDRFFDEVMVMVDDESLRHNRLALLSALRGLFLQIVDAARLGRGA